MRYPRVSLALALVLLASGPAATALAQAPAVPKAETRADALPKELAPDIPIWARNYWVRSDPTGLLYLYSDIVGCEVFVVPKRWRTLHQLYRREGKAVDYGVDVSQLTVGQEPGTIVTNDPEFGQILQQHRHTATGQCPDPDRCPSPASPSMPTTDSLFVPGAILLGAIGLILFGRRRQP